MVYLIIIDEENVFYYKIIGFLLFILFKINCQWINNSTNLQFQMNLSFSV
jgi:hypothetical protein